MHQLGEGVFALLPAGAENAGQYLMRAGTVGRTIASPVFASHRHQPDGPLGEVIGGMQARTAQNQHHSPFVGIQSPLRLGSCDWRRRLRRKNPVAL